MGKKNWAFMHKFTAQTAILGANLLVLAQTLYYHTILRITVITLYPYYIYIMTFSVWYLNQSI